MDTLGDPYHEPTVKSAKEQHIDRLIEKQKKIDDAKIALIHKALEKGIPLQDEVYLELLQFYPYYQEVLNRRQKEMQFAKRQQERIKLGEKPIVYKFEKFIRGRSNLSPQRNTIDVETVDNPEPSQDDLIRHYESILNQYEHDLEEIKVMGQSIDKDVITE